MCGIAGIMDLNGSRDVDRDAIIRMTNALHHRGPDGEGFFYEPGIGLGHRRLAIIDPAGGAQPFVSANGNTVVSFNGEIYNFRSLKIPTEQTGPTLRTDSDTEVLTEMWEQKEVGALDDVVGMYAISAWNKSTRTLTLARDRLGEKPLYYYTTEDGFLVFASEIPALLASGLIKKKLSNPAIADYFAYGYVPDPKTIYQGIWKLPSGCFVSVRQGAGELPQPTRYWQPRFSPTKHRSFPDLADELVSLLDQAVAGQMIADVPLGAFLSGGIDSSAVVASMALQSADPVRTATIGFNELSHDEREYARRISEIYHTRHTEQTASLDSMGLIDRIAGIYGEPFADTSALPTFLVCRKTREVVTVALSGDGGDEIFAGYRRYPFFRTEERIRSLLPGAIRRPLFSALGTLYPELDTMPRPLRLKSAFRSLSETAADAYFRSVSINRPEAQNAVLTEEFQHTLGNYRPQEVIQDLFTDADTDDPLLMAQQADLYTWLPGRMLVKVDRASMANSLEVRPPLLDHRIVEWAASLPPDFKLKAHNGKRILKQAMHARVPHDILYRQKQGFDLPIAAWLRQESDNPLDLLQDSEHWKSCGILNENAVIGLIDAHKAGKKDYGQELWSIIMFNAFLAQS